VEEEVVEEEVVEVSVVVVVEVAEVAEDAVRNHAFFASLKPEPEFEPLTETSPSCVCYTLQVSLAKNKSNG